jgi:biopolymer transport protein ExbD
MKFYPRRRRTAPAVIIISLIDVLIVMVVFLLVTTSFKNQPAVRIALPETAEAPKAGAGNEKPPFTITLAKDSPLYFVGTRAVTEDKLAAELKQAGKDDPQVKVIVRSDKGASVGSLVKVIEMSKAAQIKNLKILSKGPGQP